MIAIALIVCSSIVSIVGIITLGCVVVARGDQQLKREDLNIRYLLGERTKQLPPAEEDKGTNNEVAEGTVWEGIV